MNDQELFWGAFEKELEKTAVLSRVLPALKRFLKPGSKAIGAWTKKHPTIAKLLGYGAAPVAAGAAMTVGEIPFRRRQRIIHVMPTPDHIPTQFRGL